MKKYSWIAAMTLLGMLGAGPAWAEDFCSVPVPTSEGAYSGFLDSGYPVCVFRGLPFAQPPKGELRLKRPVPPAKHEGVKQALAFGPACYQEEDILNGGEADSYEEDCLYLNVWRPQTQDGPRPLPVLVWIYGGGFVGGAGSFDIYDGAHLATRENVVVVTLNYRLGALGFMALPELKSEDLKGSTGNYGVMDQVRALEWVRDNIKNFGGDPNNVTVFGQSAGSMSVCVLLTSPEAQGLFHHAMGMSGPCRQMTPLEDGYAQGKAYAEKMGCAGNEVLNCLRSKQTKDFDLKAGNDMFSGGTAWAPTVDGTFLPGNPVDLIRQGKYAKVPMIFGTTRDELRIYTITISGLGLWSRGTVSGLMKVLTGPNAPELMAMYDYKDYRRPIDLAFAFGNQMVFDTPAFMIAEAASKDNPVYLYRFDWDQTRMPHKLGAFHALDVPLVFGSFTTTSDLVKLLATKKSFELGTPIGYMMMDYLGNFARTGNPNGPAAAGGLPEWPAYNTKTRERLYVNTETAAHPLSDSELARYRWYSEHTMKQVFTGSLSKDLREKKTDK
jgi:para-nitrobenzyl esterase